jgi:tubulin-specific chaperone E
MLLSPERTLHDFAFETITTLLLDFSCFISIFPLCRSVFSLFPSLGTLSLQNNHISVFVSPYQPSKEPIPVSASINSLNLSHNSITDPALISSLPLAFPNLTSLRVSWNPFFYSTSKSAEDAAFMLTLARLPTLKMLNYSVITEKDRMDGELYYLSVAEKEIEGALRRTESFENDDKKSVLEDWVRYPELCAKYDRENVIDRFYESAKSGTTPNSPEKPRYQPRTLGGRIITITFLAPSRQETVLIIPRTIDIYRVKALLTRKIGSEWGLKPLSFIFELVHDPKEDLPDEVIPDSTRRIGDWIGEDVQKFTIRVKPRTVGMGKGKVERLDLGKLIAA